MCETLDARALLTFAEDFPAEAVRLFAVARAARKEIGAPLPPVYSKEVDRILEKCKARPRLEGVRRGMEGRPVAAVFAVPPHPFG